MTDLQLNSNRLKNKIIVTYLLIGVAFGACFPVGAIVMESILKGISLTGNGIAQMHSNNPLLYMIDSAPVFLGVFAMLGGISKAKGEVAKHKMASALEHMKLTDDENTKLLTEVRATSDSNNALLDRMTDTSQVLHQNSILLTGNMNELHGLDRRIDATIQDMDSHVEEMEAINNSLLEQFHNYDSSIEQMYGSTKSVQQEIDEHLKAVEKLTDVITTTRDILIRLTDETKEVEAVISLIADISGKIKLLALNASIESARAGDAGKGFAVVANEIKVLSEQTDEATEHIAQTIQSVTSGVRDIDGRMDTMDKEGRQLHTSNEKVSVEFKGLFEHMKVVRDSSKIAAEQMAEQNDTLASVTGQIHDVARLVEEREVKMTKSEEALSVNEEQIELLNQYTN